MERFHRLPGNNGTPGGDCHHPKLSRPPRLLRPGQSWCLVPPDCPGLAEGPRRGGTMPVATRALSCLRVPYGPAPISRRTPPKPPAACRHGRRVLPAPPVTARSPPVPSSGVMPRQYRSIDKRMRLSGSDKPNSLDFSSAGPQPTRVGRTSPASPAGSPAAFSVLGEYIFADHIRASR